MLFIIFSLCLVLLITGSKRQLQATIILKTVTGWTVKHTVLPFVAAVAPTLILHHCVSDNSENYSRRFGVGHCDHFP
ncbi:hypothetical protein Avbf_13225 [Armadillidium vulgare]|nr:hypothetical protein Avbf_13225 [Armadillidium vulgare]